jgi:PhzF family phenazine biosynthesis protein
MSQRIVQVDAFSSEPFRGNPAAVCVLEQPGEEAWMQSVAREMNLSETAFLYPRGDAYHLRWFTPSTEVELCGHATLASAHVLWQDGYLRPAEPALFEARSGRLKATTSAEGIELDFPARPAGDPAPEEVATALVEALGVQPLGLAHNPFDYIVELQSEAAVRAVRPDFGRLALIARRGVIVTASAGEELAESGVDFVSRFFAPAYGIDEDPVTGSAHCTLGPFWEQRLGRSQLTGYQASERGGLVRVRMRGERVTLIGQAVTVLEGTLLA